MEYFARIDGNLITEERTTYFYHTDLLGSTVLVTDEHGQTVWNSEYTPFGQVAKDDPGFNKAIKFTGKDLDLDTGLYYFNARWYDSDIVRFILEDPIKDGLNWYTYAVSNPDPSGLFAEDYSEGYEWPTRGLVEEEDTLGAIAEQFYGDVGAARFLAQVNKINDSDLIYPGQLIELPWIVGNESTNYRQLLFYDGGVRETPDLFIAVVVVGTGAYKGIKYLVDPGVTAGVGLIERAKEAIHSGYQTVRRWFGLGNEIGKSPQEPYAGVKRASEYLKSQGLPRNYRVQILQSFDVRTIRMRVAGDSMFGLRFSGGGAEPKGRYLFEAFNSLINRYNLSLPRQWNAMLRIQQFQVKPGTIVIEGNVAPQLEFGPNYVGGAIQWFINNLENLIP